MGSGCVGGGGVDVYGGVGSGCVWGRGSGCVGGGVDVYGGGGSGCVGGGGEWMCVCGGGGRGVDVCVCVGGGGGSGCVWGGEACVKRDSQMLFLRCETRCDVICDGCVRCELAKYHSQKKSVMRQRLADLARSSMQLGTSPWFSRGLVQLVQIYGPLLNLCTTLLYKIVRQIACRIAKVEQSSTSAMAQLRKFRGVRDGCDLGIPQFRGCCIACRIAKKASVNPA